MESSEIVYVYDDADRLVSVRYPAEAVAYQYDELGNLISEIRARPPEPAEPNRPTPTSQSSGPPPSTTG